MNRRTQKLVSRIYRKSIKNRIYEPDNSKGCLIELSDSMISKAYEMGVKDGKVLFARKLSKGIGVQYEDDHI